MIRPDDCLLTDLQFATVQRAADRLLRDASAYDRHPTPIADLMDAARLQVIEDAELDEGLLRQFMRKAKAKVSTLKSALGKVLGLFQANDRLVVIDTTTPVPRVPFVKLHEAGHATLPHQSKVYALIHDCEKTLDADIADLFEREANVFASEVLFQGDRFEKEARDHHQFGVKVPIRLAKKYGASNYSTFRRYVSTSCRTCALVVIDPIHPDLSGHFAAVPRRVITSPSFQAQFDVTAVFSVITDRTRLGVSLPVQRRMSFRHEITLVDRNGDEYIASIEAFNTTHQILALVDVRSRRTAAGIVVPCIFK